VAVSRRHHHLEVDPVACDGFGFCAELLPERVTLDEWGYPVIDGTPLEPGLVEMARRAVTECPRRALRLVGERTDRRVDATPVAVSGPGARRGR